ncbi:MAG: permease-like cell division protein FtsX [Bacilli bacterium]|nr:permease-like cell division protein FtsX [Bacilli bacterium]
MIKRKENIMRAIRVIIRNIRDAFKSVFRNFSLSFASITCSAITLLLVAIALIISFNVNYLTKQYENELTIVAYLFHDTNEEQIKEYDALLKENKNIVEYKYKSKEDWKKECQDDSQILLNALDSLSYNPLLDSYTIKVDDIKNMKKVADYVGNSDYVESVDYNEGLVEKIAVIFDIVEKVSIILVIALLVVTAFLIGNTIKLTIFSRKTEIEIMRLVGTSNIVIKLPFLFEGFILGVLGSIIPIIIMIYGYLILYDRTNGYIYSNVIKMVKPFPFIFYASLFVLVLGALMGMISSIRAVRKYLKI